MGASVPNSTSSAASASTTQNQAASSSAKVRTSAMQAKLDKEVRVRECVKYACNVCVCDCCRCLSVSGSLARVRARAFAVPFESLIHVDTFRCAQLYDECDNSSHYGGRPAEVERLVKLGANGSGYKGRVRLLSRSSRVSSLAPSSSLSLFLSLLFLSLLLLPSKDNNVLTCPPFTRIPTPSSSSSSSLMMMMMMFHLEMISFVTVDWRTDCTYLGGTVQQTEVCETHVEHNVKG